MRRIKQLLFCWQVSLLGWLIVFATIPGLVADVQLWPKWVSAMNDGWILAVLLMAGTTIVSVYTTLALQNPTSPHRRTLRWSTYHARDIWQRARPVPLHYRYMNPETQEVLLERTQSIRPGKTTPISIHFSAVVEKGLVTLDVPGGFRFSVQPIDPSGPPLRLTREVTGPQIYSKTFKVQSQFDFEVLITLHDIRDQRQNTVDVPAQ